MQCLEQNATLRRKAPAFSSSRTFGIHRSVCLRTRCLHATSRNATYQQEAASIPAPSRRALLAQSAALLLAGSAGAPAAVANPLEDVARQLTRPSDITPVQAAVALLDARSTLREMASLVASAPDSQERFNGRKLWPAYAKWLRPVGPSAPVAAAIIAGTDAEATLSAEYGGTGGRDAAVDAVYIALGKVLTISGRTIRDEAQVDPALCKEAEEAIDAVINKLPADLTEQAQQLRVARAAGKA